VIRDLAGTAALSDALAETNRLLAAVLEQLQETNAQRLGTVAAELERVNGTLDALLAAQSG